MNAKAQTAKAESSALATQSTASNMPAFLDEMVQDGVGVSSDARDLLIPNARILQKTSKEVEEGTADFVKGAKVGMVYIKALNLLIDSNKGFLFQPCYSKSVVVERTPIDAASANSIFIVHDLIDPAKVTGAEQVADQKNPDKKVWIIKSKGTELIETRYVSGFMIKPDSGPIPLVLKFESTGHTVAKGWEMMMNLARTPKGQKPNRWSIYYKLVTRMKARGQQTWYIYEVSHAGEVDAETNLSKPMWVPTAEDYERGKKLYEDLSSGKMDFDKSGGEEEENKAAPKPGDNAKM